MVRSNKPRLTNVNMLESFNVTSFPVIVTAPPFPGAEACVETTEPVRDSSPFVPSVTRPPSPPENIKLVLMVVFVMVRLISALIDTSPAVPIKDSKSGLGPVLIRLSVKAQRPLPQS